jgi:hypothetical protein
MVCSVSPVHRFGTGSAPSFFPIPSRFPLLVSSRPHVISYHYQLCVCAVAGGQETFVDSCVHDDDFEDSPAKDPDTPAVQQVDALTQCLQRVTNAAISGELSPWELAGVKQVLLGQIGTPANAAEVLQAEAAGIPALKQCLASLFGNTASRPASHSPAPSVGASTTLIAPGIVVAAHAVPFGLQ